ncbi:MAG: hypothetical protein HY064_03720 [Bacteroidetes bacterium]|nr:hypothetical protein [Bacteroidota bacterium]
MKNVNLNLNINELNSVLRALSNLPYNQVHELIAKLQQQARTQLEEGNGISHNAEAEHSNN